MTIIAEKPIVSYIFDLFLERNVGGTVGMASGRG